MIDSKHSVIPYLGYQVLEGGMVGYDLTFKVTGQRYFADTTVVSHEERAHDTHAPVVGIAYRYSPIPMVFGELSTGVMLDKSDFSYKAVVDFYGFKQQYEIKVAQSHTYFLGADIAGYYDLPYNFRVGLRGGGGYVWRELSMSSNVPATGADVTLVVSNPDKMYKVRGGADVMFHRNGILMVEGSFQYTLFIPTDSKQTSFGGLGWQFSLFPLWYGK